MKISWDKRVEFFFVNPFGKVCLFRTGGEGHPTWILFNSCLGSSSDYGKICGVRENCKMQNTTPNPVIEAPPNLLQWPHPLKHSPENRDSSTSKLASRCYPSYPSAKKAGAWKATFLELQGKLQAALMPGLWGLGCIFLYITLLEGWRDQKRPKDTL